MIDINTDNKKRVHVLGMPSSCPLKGLAAILTWCHISNTSLAINTLMTKKLPATCQCVTWVSLAIARFDAKLHLTCPIHCCVFATWSPDKRFTSLKLINNLATIPNTVRFLVNLPVFLPRQCSDKLVLAWQVIYKLESSSKYICIKW